MKKIAVVLIHNNNAERNNQIIPKLKELTKFLSTEFETKMYDFSFQPDPEIYNLKWFKFKKIFLWIKREISVTKNIYRFYKFIKLNFPILRGFKYFLIETIQKFLHLGFQKFLKVNFIISILSDKHIRAWSLLVEENDYLLVFEDDAKFYDHSFDSIKKVLKLAIESQKQNVYINLAEGLDISYMDKELKLYEKDQMIFYKSVVTNTTCAYLMSSHLAKKILGIILTMPELRLMPIDRLIDQAGMILHISNIETLCAHCSPPIIGHGSVSGEFKSFRD